MIKPELLPSGPDVLIQDTVLIDQPKVQITYQNIENMAPHSSGIPNSVISWLACNVPLVIIVTSNILFMYVSFVIYNLPLV
jgi:hypothetical protein